ncbi:zinc-binding dehydrogenase [Colletotrichum limetticola]|uniref:Zinc-binding dehydrogenase n=1 Tax=Colletotrichum limetticola TaxID=1209924 RepID=A0ABQ9P851_9PEZI|nr:zinc-binding dehydrogenase [Colletotrichum limetticola]
MPSFKQWTVEGATGFDSLKMAADVALPALGDKQVLVKFHAASLNYRDLAIAKNQFPFGFADGVVPGSDGAGVVEAVGAHVTRFKAGDKVTTLFNQGHQAGSLDAVSFGTGLGGFVDGAFREYGAFDETGLVAMPRNLSWAEASTLPCAGLTAWNALYGLEGRVLKPGDYVLTQGTGGVSLFAIQFAKAAGASVIATTSSAEKIALLKRLGADHVINYKENPHWGEYAKTLTPGQSGVHHIIEVGGPATIAQSLQAIKIDGVISIIGFLGSASAEQPTFLDCLSNLCTVRGLLVGSRLQFEDMNRSVEANDIHPVVDQKVFSLEQLPEAYQYMSSQKNLGKVVIRIAD